MTASVSLWQDLQSELEVLLYVLWCTGRLLGTVLK